MQRYNIYIVSAKTNDSKFAKLFDGEDSDEEEILGGSTSIKNYNKLLSFIEDSFLINEEIF